MGSGLAGSEVANAQATSVRLYATQEASVGLDGVVDCARGAVLCLPDPILAKFDLGSIPTGATVLSAVVGLTEWDGPYDDNTGTVYPMSQDWDLGLTPPTQLAWKTYDVSAAFAFGDSESVLFSGPSDEADVTELVREWVAGTRPNYGLTITTTEIGAARYDAGTQLYVTYVVDTTPPTVTLSGTLADEDGYTVLDPSYGLHVAAADAGAGVRRIRLAVDGVDRAIVADGTSQLNPVWTCPEGGCARAADYAFVTAAFPDGARTVTVEVTDQAGNTASKTITFTNAQFDACMLANDDATYCAESDREDRATVPADQPETVSPDVEPDYQDCLDAYPGHAEYCTPDPYDDDGLLRSAATSTRWGIADENLTSLAVLGSAPDLEPTGAGTARFDELQVKRVRRILPYNIMRLRDLGTSAYPRPAWMTDDGVYNGLRQTYTDFRKLYDWATKHSPAIELFVTFEHRRDLEDADASYQMSGGHKVLVNDRPVVVKDGNASYRPSVDEYIDNVRRFNNRFPKVRFIGSWNEPNNASQPTRYGNKNRVGYGPERAAVYANHLADTVCKPSADRCRVVAGEFVDSGLWRDYYIDYRDALDFQPAYWGLHPYVDVNYSEQYRRTSNPKNLSKSNASYFNSHLPGDPFVWFTEVGARIDTTYNGPAQNPLAFTPTELLDKLTAANEDTAFLVDRLAANIGGGVNRVYYYQLCEPKPDVVKPRHDSGLLDRGEGCGAPRPMFGTYKTVTTATPYG